MNDATAPNFGRAIVIESSLTRALPNDWQTRLLSRRAHRLDGLEEIIVLEFRVDAADDGRAALDLAARLRAPGFYAHIIRGDRLIVVFPNTIFVLERGDSNMIDRCSTYGRSLAIPDSQMRFHRMFDVDHPDEVTT